MGRNDRSTTGTVRRPQSSKRSRSTYVTPWHEAGIEELDAYSRMVEKDREGWR